MKIYKKIIAVLVFALVIVSTFLVFIPSASATVVNGTSYDWKVYQGQLNLSEYPDSSFSQYNYITVGCDDWKLSGYGYFGYDKSIDSFYVQIDKYAGANGSWVLKLDSDKYWKYRDGLNDYGSMESIWHSMKTEPKDIYITFGGIDLNDSNDTWWLTKTLTYSPSYTCRFTGEGIATFTHSYDRYDLATLPDYSRDGYVLQGWKTYDASGKEWFYEVGKIFNVTSNVTFEAVWEKLPTYTFTFTGEGVTTFTQSIEQGVYISLPDYDRPGYDLKGWKIVGGNGYIYPVGQRISGTGDCTFEAVWEYEPVKVEFYDDLEVFESYTIEINYGETLTFPDLPSSTQYGLKANSWYCDGRYYHPGDTINYTQLYNMFGYDVIFSIDWAELKEPMIIRYYQFCSTTKHNESIGYEPFLTLEVYEDYIVPEYFLGTYDGHVFHRYCNPKDGSDILVGDVITYREGGTYDISVFYWCVYNATFTGDDFEDFTIQSGENQEIILPSLPEGVEDENFYGWTDGKNFYKEGQTLRITSDKVFNAVFGEEVVFQGEGFDTFTLVTDQDGLIIIPTLPEGTTREGFIFDGWSDGAYIYKTGMKYNCVEKNNYTFTAVWKEVSGVGSDGTDDGDLNFITKFFVDTYDATKMLVEPYLTDFEIPFLNCTLADIIEFFFFALIAGLIVWLVSLVI